MATGSNPVGCAIFEQKREARAWFSPCLQWHEASDRFRPIRTADLVTLAGRFEVYGASRYFEIDRTCFLRPLEHAQPDLDESLLKLDASNVAPLRRTHALDPIESGSMRI